MMALFFRGRSHRIGEGQSVFEILEFELPVQLGNVVFSDDLPARHSGMKLVYFIDCDRRGADPTRFAFLLG
jgi:hypothetical protein